MFGEDMFMNPTFSQLKMVLKLFYTFQSADCADMQNSQLKVMKQIKYYWSSKIDAIILMSAYNRQTQRQAADWFAEVTWCDVLYAGGTVSTYSLKDADTL